MCDCNFGGNPPRRGRGVPKLHQIFVYKKKRQKDAFFFGGIRPLAVVLLVVGGELERPEVGLEGLDTVGLVLLGKEILLILREGCEVFLAVDDGLCNGLEAQTAGNRVL